jgi:hypothetical protein
LLAFIFFENIETFGIKTLTENRKGQIALPRRKKQALDDPHLASWASTSIALKDTPALVYLQIVPRASAMPGGYHTPTSGNVTS